MKAVILAGGLGTRLSEETATMPKPMVPIGGRPILWHIMKMYEGAGITDFLVLLGYKGYVVKEYFANYSLHQADLTVDLASGQIAYHRRGAEPWRVSLFDTGESSMTGGRLGRVREHLSDTFCLTYGDGVADVDIAATIEFHKAHGLPATMTTVVPPGRFGAVVRDGDRVKAFAEKPAGDGGEINGGFFVFEPRVLDLIAGDECVLESDVLPQLAAKEQLMAFKHGGFWQAMDTLRDKRQLESLWTERAAPWTRRWV